MFENYRVIAVTPAGRKRYLELLCYQTYQNRNLIDEHHLWVNTSNTEDIQYMEKMSKSSFFKFIPSPTSRKDRFDGFSIHEFFPLAMEENTIYIRFDDDIVYIAPDAIINLLKARIKYKDAPLVYANTINNAICSHLLQRLGKIDNSKGVIGYNCMDGLGWSASWFAVIVHNNFLEKGYEFFKMNDWHLLEKEKVSINCICWFGGVLKSLNLPVGRDEEPWLACDLPRILNQNNVIAGDAIVSHYAYHPQRGFLDQTDILSKYKKLVGQGKLVPLV